MNIFGNYVTQIWNDGNVSQPAEFFGSEPGLGIYRDTGGTQSGLSIAQNGTQCVKINTSGLFVNGTISASGITPSGQLYFVDGTVSAPGLALSSDHSTGIFRQGAATLGFASGGSDVFQVGGTIQSFAPIVTNNNTIGMGSGTLGCGGVTSTGVLKGPSGSVTAPSFEFSSSTNSGLYFDPAASGPALSAQGVECFSAGTSGLVCGSQLQVGTNGMTSIGTISSTQALTCGALTSTSVTSTGTLSTGGNSITCGAITASGTFSNAPNAMSCGPLTCTTVAASGSISCTSLTTSGTLSTGANAITCGPITSSGTFSNAPNAMSCGALNCTTVTASGSISCTSLTTSGTLSTGSNGITCGPITSSGTFSSGANSVTCGPITSSGTFSNGTNSITCGPITSSGTFSCGANSLTCGAIIASGTISTPSGSANAVAIEVGGNAAQGFYNPGGSVIRVQCSGGFGVGTNAAGASPLTCGALTSLASTCSSLTTTANGNITLGSSGVIQYPLADSDKILFYNTTNDSKIDTTGGWSTNFRSGNSGAGGTANSGTFKFYTAGTGGSPAWQNVTSISNSGTINLNNTGATLFLATGSNACRGSVTLVGGTATVNTTAVTSASYIGLSNTSVGGTAGFYTISIVAATSFTITSSSILDTSTLQWIIFG